MFLDRIKEIQKREFDEKQKLAKRMMDRKVITEQIQGTRKKNCFNILLILVFIHTIRIFYFLTFFDFLILNFWFLEFLLSMLLLKL